MSTEYFDTLERQLVMASHRMTNEHAARRRRRYFGRRPLLAAIVALLCASTAYAVSSKAPWAPAELIGKSDPRAVPTLTAAALPQPMTSVLNIVRRPQTGQDRGPETRAVLKHFGNERRKGTYGHVTIYSNAIRSVRAEGDVGPPVTIVPLVRNASHGAPGERAPAGVTTETQIWVWVPDPVDAGGAFPVSPDYFKHPQTVGSMGAFHFGLAPDGVTRVRLTWIGYPPVETTVTDNFYGVEAPPGAQGGPTATWFDADGKPVPGLS